MDIALATWRRLDLDLQTVTGFDTLLHLILLCSVVCIQGQDPCKSNPCTNGGSCVVLAPTVFSCSCSTGFTGVYCHINIDECVSAPCRNGGTCTDQVGGYSCVCPNNFSGQNCQQAVTKDPCQSSPCLNGGTCLTKGQNSFLCDCVSGFTGNHCETDIDECASSPCQNGGVCTDGVASFSCSCTNSFWGQFCEHDVDDCASSPCEHGGTCIDQAGGFSCVCPAQFTGPSCQQVAQIPELTSRLVEGTNSSLTVNCSFPPTPVGQVQTLLSLIVTRKPLTDTSGDGDQELASIHIEHPSLVNLLSARGANGATRKPSGASVTAAPPTNSTGHINAILGSVLSLTWTSPNSSEEGVYACVAGGLDSLGHIVTMTSSRLVKRSSDLDRFRTSLDRVRKTLQQSQSCCASLNQRVASLSWTFTRLSRALAHIEKNTVLTPYQQYLTHKYYTALFPLKRFTTAQGVCDALGGHVAEIGDRAENEAVIDLLQLAQPKLAGYYLGGQDSTREKHWIWTSSNSKMNFSDWKIGEPNNLAEEDCLEMRSDVWKWNDIRCTRIIDDRGFLCEI